MSETLEAFKRETINILMIELFGIYIHHVYEYLENIKGDIRINKDKVNFAGLASCTSFSKIGFAQKNQKPNNDAVLKDTLWSIYKCFEYFLTNDIEDENIKEKYVEAINKMLESEISYYLSQGKES